MTNTCSSRRVAAAFDDTFAALVEVSRSRPGVSVDEGVALALSATLARPAPDSPERLSPLVRALFLAGPAGLGVADCTDPQPGMVSDRGALEVLLASGVARRRACGRVRLRRAFVDQMRAPRA